MEIDNDEQQKLEQECNPIRTRFYACLRPARCLAARNSAILHCVISCRDSFGAEFILYINWLLLIYIEFKLIWLDFESHYNISNINALAASFGAEFILYINWLLLIYIKFKLIWLDFEIHYNISNINALASKLLSVELIVIKAVKKIINVLICCYINDI